MKERSDAQRATGIKSSIIFLLAAISFLAFISNEVNAERNKQNTNENNNQEASQSTVNRAPPVDTLINGLKKRLAENPHDTEGWQLLIKSYQFLNMPQQAAWAMRQAQRYSSQPDNSDSELKQLLAPALHNTGEPQ